MPSRPSETHDQQRSGMLVETSGCEDVIEPMVKKTIRLAWSSLRLERQS